MSLFSSPTVAYNPLLQLILVLTGRTAMSVVPKVSLHYTAQCEETITPFFKIFEGFPDLRQFAMLQHLWVPPFPAACLELSKMVKRKPSASLRLGRPRWFIDLFLSRECSVRGIEIVLDFPKTKPIHERHWIDKHQVIKEVPADRLLVWQVKQGWEPLCKVMLFSVKCWSSRTEMS